MNTLLSKQAYTQLPLSPEEQYEASQLVGKSLFSALQLMRDQELRKQKLMSSGGDDNGKTLRIPIHESLMPSKVAEDDLSPYNVESFPGEIPRENPGLIPHIRRNIGKYLGSYGGAMIGGALGARRAHRGTSNPSKLELLKRISQRGLTGALSGSMLGNLYDENTKSEYIQKMQQQRNMQQALAEQILSEQYKHASDSEDFEPGLIGRAFKAQQNPLKLLVGAQTGFKDAKKDYYMMQKSLINKELDQAQREYMDLLEKIKTGEEKEKSTPYVDSFCNGIAYEALFEKKAFEEDVDIADDSIKRMLGSAMSYAKKPFQPAIDTAASGLLGTGGGAAYLTYLLRKTMREEPDKYMQEHLPTRVELQPYA